MTVPPGALPCVWLNAIPVWVPTPIMGNLGWRVGAARGCGARSWSKRHSARRRISAPSAGAPGRTRSDSANMFARTGLFYTSRQSALTEHSEKRECGLSEAL